jgi:hypothetical protein
MVIPTTSARDTKTASEETPRRPNCAVDRSLEHSHGLNDRETRLSSGPLARTRRTTRHGDPW